LRQQQVENPQTQEHASRHITVRHLTDLLKQFPTLLHRSTPTNTWFVLHNHTAPINIDPQYSLLVIV
jgi:hypothetical protein